MTFDFSLPLLDLDNKPIEENGKPVTFASVIGTQLLNSPESPESPESKIKSFTLATKIYGSSSVDLSADEITFIIEKIGKIAPPMVIGRVNQFLDIKEK